MFRRCWVLSIVGLVLVGCGPSGPPMAPVSGVVTYQGEPVAHAMVTLFPSGIPDARIAFAMTDEQGRFESVRSRSPGDGAAVGSHLVTVTESWPPGAEIPTTEDGMQLPPPRGPWGAEYRDAASSPLKAEVVAKTNNHLEIDLQP